MYSKKDKQLAFANTTSNTHAPLRGFSFINAYGVIVGFGARMNSVQRAITNEQLDQFDVKRSEVEQHAEMLITGAATAK